MKKQNEIQKKWDDAGKKDNKEKWIIWLECLNLQYNEENFTIFFDELTKTNCLEWSEKYFLYWQALGRLFTKSSGWVKSSESRFKAYCSITEEFQAKFQYFKPIENRNKQVVLVTTQQFLGMQHAPTRITLDRANMLKKAGKKVIIVNTAEMYGGQFIGAIHSICPNYNAELNSHEWVEYSGYQFPYIQFPQGSMPSVEGAEIFYEYVKKLKPAYIVNIGGNSLILDGCAKLVPVLNINTVASDIECTQATKQVLGRKVFKEDITLLKYLGKNSQDVIVGRFTLSLKQQEHQLTRGDLGLPTDRFLLAVIGTRLTEELNDVFWDMLEERLLEGAFLVIIGNMDNYELVCSRKKSLRENSAYLGMQSDLQAVLECCDLYVNPQRIGGGTSAIYALYKGIPVVTLREGDVALGVGYEFCVDTYNDMSRQIAEYMYNKQFYRQMAEKAKSRARYMLDSESAFLEILSSFESTCV